MFSKLFSKKANVEKELNEKLKKLELELQEKEIELRKIQLREKIGKVQAVKKEEEKPQPQQFNPKQVEIFEKNLRDLKNENQFLKNELISLKNQNIDSPCPVSKHKYRVSLDKFYSGIKFNEILEKFQELEVFYLDQLCDEHFQILDKNLKSYSEAKVYYLALKEGKISWELKICALKGEKISKVFTKNRKFYLYLNEEYLEFMEDISQYDFNKLLKIGFKKEQIEELIEKKNHYEKEYRLR